MIEPRPLPTGQLLYTLAGVLAMVFSAAFMIWFVSEVYQWL